MKPIRITKLRLAIKIVLLICALLYLSCSTKISTTGSIKIKDFNSRAWKRDSLSCNDKRPYLAKILVEHKASLINLNKNQIINLLGKPNGDKNQVYGYFIENGTQCSNVNNKDYTGNQTKLLLIEFKKDLVTDVYIIVP